MHRKIKWYVLLCTIGVLILAGVASQSSADLDERTENAIHTAFMNGYVAALRLDIEQIKQIKQNRKLMKQFVQNAARKYIAVVNDMN